MSDEIPIGPNRCVGCGGEYGEHAEDCRSLAGSNCSAASWPDIGLDPLKHRDKVTGGVEGARERLSKAVSIQQKEVPDQTLLAWRIDVSRVLDELTLMTARWEYLQKRAALPPNSDYPTGNG